MSEEPDSHRDELQFYVVTYTDDRHGPFPSYAEAAEAGHKLLMSDSFQILRLATKPPPEESS